MAGQTPFAPYSQEPFEPWLDDMFASPDIPHENHLQPFGDVNAFCFDADWGQAGQPADPRQALLPTSQPPAAMASSFQPLPTSQPPAYVAPGFQPLPTSQPPAAVAPSFQSMGGASGHSPPVAAPPFTSQDMHSVQLHGLVKKDDQQYSLLDSAQMGACALKMQLVQPSSEVMQLDGCLQFRASQPTAPIPAGMGMSQLSFQPSCTSRLLALQQSGCLLPTLQPITADELAQAAQLTLVPGCAFGVASFRKKEARRTVGLHFKCFELTADLPALYCPGLAAFAPTADERVGLFPVSAQLAVAIVSKLTGDPPAASKQPPGLNDCRCDSNQAAIDLCSASSRASSASSSASSRSSSSSSSASGSKEDSRDTCRINRRRSRSPSPTSRRRSRSRTPIVQKPPSPRAHYLPGIGKAFGRGLGRGKGLLVTDCELQRLRERQQGLFVALQMMGKIQDGLGVQVAKLGELEEQQQKQFSGLRVDITGLGRDIDRLTDQVKRHRRG